MNLNGHYYQSFDSEIIISSSAQINPDIRLQTGTIINGLYPDFTSGFNETGSGQTLHVSGGTYTFSSNLTVNAGRGLQFENATVKFSTNKYLYVYGTLYGENTTFTRTSGTWGGIKFQSGSSGSLYGCTINNAN
ncbi:MAG: hypothetical protein KAI81_00535 [Candidatus Marinimicrobia bacterium]|nr:hypothetical protein [Candidatus Neomarinimicrobiota bacterium]